VVTVQGGDVPGDDQTLPLLAVQIFPVEGDPEAKSQVVATAVAAPAGDGSIT
jgi:hypothetical protein